jgi:hypothetical protein
MGVIARWLLLIGPDSTMGTYFLHKAAGILLG